MLVQLKVKIKHLIETGMNRTRGDEENTEKKAVDCL